MPNFQMLPGLTAILLVGTTAAMQPPAVDSGLPATSPASRSIVSAPSRAELLVDEAIQKLRALKSVSADLLMEVEMLEQSFRLRGSYLRAEGNRVLLDLRLEGLPEAVGSMRQVCDGQTLWDIQQVLDGFYYGKTDVARVLEKLNQPGLEPEIRDRFMVELGFAGPETLLVSLRKSIGFDTVLEVELNGRPAYLVRGVWRDRAALTGGDPNLLPPVGPLPPYVPSVVNLWLDRDSGWPLKLDMEGKLPSLLEATENPATLDVATGKNRRLPAKRPNFKPSRLVLNYLNIQVNLDIDPNRFAYQVPANERNRVEDRTEFYLTSIDQVIQAQAGLRKFQEQQRQADTREGSTPPP
jgi:hypothetical protein